MDFEEINDRERRYVYIYIDYVFENIYLMSSNIDLVYSW